VTDHAPKMAPLAIPHQLLRALTLNPFQLVGNLR
jgi:hypothetical protein